MHVKGLDQHKEDLIGVFKKNIIFDDKRELVLLCLFPRAHMAEGASRGVPCRDHVGGKRASLNIVQHIDGKKRMAIGISGISINSLDLYNILQSNP